ncbi:MAG TPA: YkgJ family cysteine cluster protein [Candidatus Angelobacter sp.]|nr:YkgJ family cysteine cluster protein [Candidatus Angelobacter sp.]
MLPSGDRELVQIIDAALADATRRSGHWLVCRKGCTQCCIGAFAINQLDAARLRRGLAQLEAQDPQRAARIRERARQSVARIAADFPGDRVTGALAEDQHSEDRFLDFANDEPCPVLDPETGGCDLYASRPLTCRVFGPPVRSGPENGLGVCELCFHGASPEEIAACEMQVDPDNLEAKVLRELEKSTGARGKTIVAFCLAS